MNNAALKTIALKKAVSDIIRSDRRRLMAGLVSQLDGFQFAEYAMQD